MGVQFRHVVLLIACAGPSLAFGQAAIDAGTARAARSARLDARLSRVMAKTLPPTAAVPVVMSETVLAIGAAYDEGGDGHSLTTPFLAAHRRGTADDWWKLELTGDGYTSGHPADEASTHGLADVQIDVWHSLYRQSLSGLVGLTLPAKGHAGSQAAAQRVKLIYDQDVIDIWNTKTTVSVSHANGAPSGVSSFRQTAYFELSQNFTDRKIVLFNVLHSRRGGTKAFTDLGAEVDFPFGKSKFDGAASLTRGVSSGSRHTGLELQVSYTF